MIRRYPYRPYAVANSMIRATSRGSSSGTNQRSMPMRRPHVPKDATGPPLRHAQPRAHPVHGLTAPGRAQKFPEATSP